MKESGKNTENESKGSPKGTCNNPISLSRLGLSDAAIERQRRKDAKLDWEDKVEKYQDAKEKYMNSLIQKWSPVMENKLSWIFAYNTNQDLNREWEHKIVCRVNGDHNRVTNIWINICEETARGKFLSCKITTSKHMFPLQSTEFCLHVYCMTSNSNQTYERLFGMGLTDLCHYSK